MILSEENILSVIELLARVKGLKGEILVERPMHYDHLNKCKLIIEFGSTGYGLRYLPRVLLKDL